MSIKHLIVHVVKRDSDGEDFNKNLKSKENDITNIAEKLTKGLINLFGTSSLSVGEFALDGDVDAKPQLEQNLDDYFDEKLICSDFVEFTRAQAVRYESVILKKGLSSVKGGYLIFYQYENRGDDWLAIVILNKTEGIDISEDLDLISSQILDLNKLHLGAAINLTKWKSGVGHRYIKFKAGLAREVRDYFEDYVGCQRDRMAARRETKDLKDAINVFCKDVCGFKDDEASSRLASAHSYISKCKKDGDPIFLRHVANHVFPERSEEFFKYSQEEKNISDDLVIDNTTLRSYLKISARTKELSISFDRGLLQKTITYNKKTGLVIKEIPQSLVSAIEEELDQRNKKDE